MAEDEKNSNEKKYQQYTIGLKEKQKTDIDEYRIRNMKRIREWLGETTKSISANDVVAFLLAQAEAEEVKEILQQPTYVEINGKEEMINLQGESYHPPCNPEQEHAEVCTDEHEKQSESEDEDLTGTIKTNENE